MMSESAETVPPPMEPGFLRPNSWVYRLEYTVAFIAIVGILLGWRWRSAKVFPLKALGFTVFWFLCMCSR